MINMLFLINSNELMFEINTNPFFEVM